MNVKIIQKTLLSLLLITLTLPIIFTNEIVTPYTKYTEPRFELFAIPISFLILLILTVIWEDELGKLKI